MYRRRWLVLAIAAVGMLAAAVWGTGVVGKVQSAGGFASPGSQSQREASLAARTFGRDSGDVVVVYSSQVGTPVREPGFRRAVTSTLSALPERDVASYATYWSTGSPRFVSADGRQTYAVVELRGRSDAQRIASFNAISGELQASGLITKVGGLIPTEAAINHEVTSDI